MVQGLRFSTISLVGSNQLLFEYSNEHILIF